MLSVDFTVALLWDSWVDAALWDLLGMTLWGSLIASGVLMIVGVVRRSPWTLMLATVLSLVFCVPVALMYTDWALVVPVTQAAMAASIAGFRRLQHA
jgi:hypothetical protein